MVGTEMMSCGAWEFEEMEKERQQLKTENRAKERIFTQPGETSACLSVDGGYAEGETEGKIKNKAPGGDKKGWGARTGQV